MDIDLTSADLWSLVRQRKRWDVTKGWQMAYTWEGPSEGFNNWLATREDFYTALDLDEETERIDPDTGYAYGHLTVTITYQLNESSLPVGGSGDGRITDPVWTMPMEEREIGILETDNAQLLRAYSPSWIGWIIKNTEYFQAGVQLALDEGRELPTYDPTLSNPSGAPPDLVALATELGYLLIDNPDLTRTISVPHLQKIETVITASTLKAGHDNVDRILTWSTLAAAEPTLLSAPLVDTTKLQEYHWLKLTPRVEPVSGGVWQIIQRWQGIKAWVAFMYGPAL